jgi:hypothetical protein
VPSFPRGARPSPRHKLLAARPHTVVKAPPPQFAVVPKTLSYWLNNQEGDCVTAEEAFAKAWWAVFCGLDELLIPDSEVGRWARKYGFADGAGLTDVMDEMAKDGFTVGGQNYKDGPYTGVDYSNELVLQSAISQGPVKIAIDASALPSGAGNGNGWYSTSGGNYRNTDHCVGLAGYGPAGWLFQQLGLPLPSGLSADAPGYLLFTWSSIGFVAHQWLMGTCTEAWLRTPTTQGQGPGPTPPLVPPNPPPTPAPPAPSGLRAFFLWLLSLLHLTVKSDVQAVFAKYGVAPQAIPAWIVSIINALATAAPKILPIVLADIQAGKTFLQILDDCLAALTAP